MFYFLSLGGTCVHVELQTVFIEQSLISLDCETGQADRQTDSTSNVYNLFGMHAINNIEVCSYNKHQSINCSCYEGIIKCYVPYHIAKWILTILDVDWSVKYILFSYYEENITALHTYCAN